jgi:hypothetical protein
MVASICGVYGQKKSICGISRVREGGQGQRGSSGTYGVVVIDDERSRICGPPAKNFNGRRLRLRGERGKVEEMDGFL